MATSSGSGDERVARGRALRSWWVPAGRLRRVVPTWQPAPFGRVYAAYEGVFVVLSLLWRWCIDGHRPDVPGIVGSVLCLTDMAVIMYWPRR